MEKKTNQPMGVWRQRLLNLNLNSMLWPDACRKFTSRISALVIAGLLLLGPNARLIAADVVWQTPMALTDYTVIYDAQADGGSQPGKSVYQLNFINYTYVGAGTTISSWPVLDQKTMTGDNDFLIGSFTGGFTHNNFIQNSPSGWDSTSMTTIMDGGRYDFTTFTLSNLSFGQNYLIQFLVADNRDYIGPANRSETITAGGNTSGALTYGIDAPNFASSVIGTFVADATSLDFTFNSFSSTQVNSIFVTAVPEPSSALLGSFGGIFALLLRKRKKDIGYSK